MDRLNVSRGPDLCLRSPGRSARATHDVLPLEKIKSLNLFLSFWRHNSYWFPSVAFSIRDSNLVFFQTNTCSPGYVGHWMKPRPVFLVMGDHVAETRKHRPLFCYCCQTGKILCRAVWFYCMRTKYEERLNDFPVA